MKPLKLILSALLLIIWFAATIILALACIVTVFPALILFVFPELMLVWLIPALFVLVYGGWIEPPPEEETSDFLESLVNQEDYH
jgi:hypothetical protein